MENYSPPRKVMIEICHKLLLIRDFIGTWLIANIHHLAGNDWPEINQAKAICDVLIAAKNQLPSGLMDYYGMIRVNRLGPVLLDDFRVLMNLLNGRQNPFPLSQEAADYALQAWSVLSKPDLKASYDHAISYGQGTDKGKRKIESVMVYKPVPLRLIPADSFITKKQSVEVISISDDDDDDETHEISGKRVKKLMKKKNEECSQVV